MGLKLKMFDDFKDDLSWSAKLFINQVWPQCKYFCGNGELLQMEGRPDNELASLFDIRAGIDGWQIHKDGMRGIASRVQVPNPMILNKFPYNSFTIRWKRDNNSMTEYEKRKLAIDTGRWIYPLITIQAYAKTESGPILSIGLAKTVDIFDFIKKGYHEFNRTFNAVFAICYWNEMIRRGYEVKILNDIRKPNAGRPNAQESNSRI